MDTPVAILQDLSGPKIRITEIDESEKTLDNNSTTKLFFGDNTNKSTASKIYVSSLDPTKILKPGHSILLADGLIVLECSEVSDSHVDCKVIKGGELRSRVGIAFPDSDTQLPATTEKDIEDFHWGLANNVDFFAISFVQRAADIKRLRKIAGEKGQEIKVIAKIELKIALDNIDEILEETDAIMVARGDLGVELPIEKIPLTQKMLIEKSNNKGKPVIVATQMLHSMVHSMRPTRAEVVDCANAVMTGADAVMLSEETAIGSFPKESVEYLNKISIEAETSFTFEEYKLRLRHTDDGNVPDAVAYAACAAAAKIGAACIIACTETGTTARLVAKYRPKGRLFGLSRNPGTLRRMALNYGVIPISMGNVESHSDEMKSALSKVKEIGNFSDGTNSVIIGGLSVNSPGSTSVLQIHQIGEKK
ncbi:UNVERIFIED_CONTAM: hypothetical protein GTU68_037464 [Idotea baltica]|nr:hypothetical protein [Idotea baltica]